MLIDFLNWLYNKQEIINETISKIKDLLTKFVSSQFKDSKKRSFLEIRKFNELSN